MSTLKKKKNSLSVFRDIAVAAPTKNEKQRSQAPKRQTAFTMKVSRRYNCWYTKCTPPPLPLPNQTPQADEIVSYARNNMVAGEGYTPKMHSRVLGSRGVEAGGGSSPVDTALLLLLLRVRRSSHHQHARLWRPSRLRDGFRRGGVGGGEATIKR